LTGIISDNGSGASSLVKSGSGILTLGNGSARLNSYSGGTWITQGTLFLKDSIGSSALGTGDVFVADGGTLSFRPGTSLPGNKVTIAGTRSGLLAPLYVAADSPTLASLALSGDAVIASDNSSGNGLNVSGGVDLSTHTLTVGSTISTRPITITFLGPVTGAGGLTLDADNISTGSATLKLSSANTFLGDTLLKVNASASGAGLATLQLNHVNALWNSTLNTESASAFKRVTFTVAGNNTYNLGGLKGADDLAIGGNTLNVGANGQDTSFTGSISSTGGGLIKSGAGTLTLSGANSYTGATVISNGTLALSASGSIASTVISVATNATWDVSSITAAEFTLPGTGTLALNLNKTGATLTQGQLALGSKNLTCNGALTLTATGDPLAAGDSFPLITTSGSRSGWFSIVNLPALTGLAWDTNSLASSGVLDVYEFTTTALALTTPVNSAATISALKLSHHASSSRATAYAATATAPSHGTATVDGSGNLIYTPATGYSGSDSFALAFQDGHGTQTMAVTVTVGSGPAPSPNVVYGPATVGGNFVVRFAGMPGTSYTVEKTASLVPPNWIKLGNFTAPADNTLGFGIGVFEVTDSVGSGSGYYRTVYPSY
ncbi:MAG: autotransporter-associated beta strand repeat-containing protein, partial [Verrucomicrobiota bacterium]